MTFANTSLYGLPGVWKLTSNSFCFSIQIAVSKTAIKKNARKETLSILQPWTFQFGKPNCSGVLCAGTKEQSLLPWECHMLSPAIWLGCLPTVHFCPGSEAAPSHSHYLFFWGSLQHFFLQTKDLKVASHTTREVMGGETLADEAFLANGKI